MTSNVNFNYLKETNTMTNTDRNTDHNHFLRLMIWFFGLCIIGIVWMALYIQYRYVDGDDSNHPLIISELTASIGREGLQNALDGMVFEVSEDNAAVIGAGVFSSSACSDKQVELSLPLNTKDDLALTLYFGYHGPFANISPWASLGSWSTIADTDFERVKTMVIDSVIGYGKACKVISELKKARPHTRSYPAVAKSIITMTPGGDDYPYSVKVESCGSNIQVKAPIESSASMKFNIGGTLQSLELPSDFFEKNSPDKALFTLVAVIDAVHGKCT